MCISPKYTYTAFSCKCTCYNFYFQTLCLVDSPQKHQHLSEETFLLGQLLSFFQGRYATEGKSFAALMCLPRICSREEFYGAMGFSTLDINTAMLAASSTVVEHAKCHHVRGSHLQSQNQFMPRLPEDVIPSCQLLVYVLKQKLLKILQNYMDPLLVLQENIFKLQAKKPWYFFFVQSSKLQNFMLNFIR